MTTNGKLIEEVMPQADETTAWASTDVLSGGA